MIHIPGPRLCPACNVVHKIGKLSSAQELRPFFNTYLPIAGSDSTPLVTFGTLSGTLQGSAINPTISVTSDGIGGTTGSGGSVLTVNKTGIFFVYAYINTSGNPQTHDVGWYIQVNINGATQTLLGGSTNNKTELPYNGGNSVAHAAWRGVITAGQTVSFTVNSDPKFSDAPINSGSYFEITFIPTPTYRR